jgi:UDP-N-acetylmuramoylalanine--D-glutamate ligase
MMSAVRTDFAETESDAKVLGLDGRNVVVGLGVTGLSVARFLRARGALVRVLDSRAHPPGLDVLRAEYPDTEVITQSLAAGWLGDAARVFLSPGLSVELPIVAAARERGVPVLNDIELFARLVTAPVLAVTGSNGKSTVATLVAEMLVAQGLRAPAGGNLGTPALDLLAEAPADAYVLEISSFQMETADSLAPAAAAVLNVTPDHLDRHHDVAHYAALKEKLLRNAARAIINWDDPIVRAMGDRHPKAIAFSIEQELPNGYSLVTFDGEPWLARNREPLIAVAEVAMRGRHNLANALAALALVASLGGDQALAVEVLRRFKGLPHRCEFVADRRGVAYINDSKATNIGAAIAALQGFATPLVLIAGGDGKGADFTLLREHVRDKVKTVVLIGVDAPKLERALADVSNVVRVATLDEAVTAAAEAAEAGDTVLLAPACSSLDMFSDYRARGEAFKAAVARLPA